MNDEDIQITEERIHGASLESSFFFVVSLFLLYVSVIPLTK